MFHNGSLLHSGPKAPEMSVDASKDRISLNFPRMECDGRNNKAHITEYRVTAKGEGGKRIFQFPGDDPNLLPPPRLLNK